MEPGRRRTIGSPRVHSQGVPTTGRVSRRSRAAGHSRGRHHLYEPVWTETSRRSEHWPRRRKGLPPPLEPTGAHRNPAAESQAEGRTPPAALARPPARPPRTLSFPSARPTGIQPGTCKKRLGPRTRRTGTGTQVTAPPPGFARPGRIREIPTAWSLAGEQRAHKHADTRTVASRVVAKDKERDQAGCRGCACAREKPCRTTLPRRPWDTQRQASLERGSVLEKREK